jgi:trypsin-like peptidase
LSETPGEQLLADPRGFKFDIQGTGFLVEPGTVLTCAHVVEEVERRSRKRRGRPHAKALQFFYAAASGRDDVVTMAVRPLEVIEKNDELDIAFLRVDSVEPAPLALVSPDYVPSVGEPIGLCSYAHGSLLTTWGGKIERVGPLVQAGIISALSPFDVRQPLRVVLDLVTGRAASGSPVFRQRDGQVIGFLVEGQVKGSAAFSIARLVFSNAAGVITVPTFGSLKASPAADGT